MTEIASTLRELRHRLALTLPVAILLGFSGNVFAQQSVARVEHQTAESAWSASLPDAPSPQQAGVANQTNQANQIGQANQTDKAIQSGQAPTPIPGNPSSLAQAPGVAPASAAGSVQGLVTDRDGVPYQGVRVTLTHAVATPTVVASSTTAGGTNAGSIPLILTVFTDSNGNFQFRPVPAGAFQLVVTSDGFATQVRTGSLNPGENLEEPSIALLLASTSAEIQVTASQHDIAQAQLIQEEQQRVLGVIPNFFVVYAPNAPPLSTRQKYHLAFRYSIDPVSFAAAAVIAGIEQDDDDFKGYGQGVEGYAKRFGAVYADSFIGGMLGSAVLPSLFKQDPRYFYKGTGSKKSRALYAIESSFICRGDNGKRQFNYSGVLGGLAGAGISNLYYPAADRDGAGLTFENTLIGIGTGSLQNLFQEFVVRHLTPKVPDYGASKP